MTIRAALFDMDGTLVDSESQTDEAVRVVMARRAHADVLLPAAETRGRSWSDIASALRTRFHIADSSDALTGELSNTWAASIDGMLPMPGAAQALEQASRILALAIVSSSPRAMIDRVLASTGLDRFIPRDHRIGADDVTRPKPDPAGFLLGASTLGVRPEECLVFEDSQAGLRAARAAGMASMVVLYRCAEPDTCLSLATGACLHYLSLPPSFWTDVVAQGASMLRQEWR